MISVNFAGPGISVQSRPDGPFEEDGSPQGALPGGVGETEAEAAGINGCQTTQSA